MVADRRIVLDLDVGAGAAFICPECGKALGAPPALLQGGGRRFALLLGAALLVIGGSVYAGSLLHLDPKDHSRLPPWLDPANETHAAEAPPAPPKLQLAATVPPPATPRAAEHIPPPPPHVSPVPPRPTQPVPSQSVEMALGSAALIPLMVSVTNRLAEPPPATLPAVQLPPEPKFTFDVPAYLELPDNQPATTQDGVYNQYHALVDFNRRVPIDFHFAPHSISLDEAGMGEIDHLVQYLIAAHAQTDRVILVGFSDNDTSRPHSLDLARHRAAVVAAVLAQHGVRVAQSVAFGSDLPVAGNGTDTGREKNRRVEVYVR